MPTTEETVLWGWCHHYTYTHPFSAGARPVVVQANFAETNQNDPPAVVDLLDAALDPVNPLGQREVQSYTDEEVQ